MEEGGRRVGVKDKNSILGIVELKEYSEKGCSKN